MHGEVSELTHMASLHFKLFFPPQREAIWKVMGPKDEHFIYPKLGFSNACHSSVSQ